MPVVGTLRAGCWLGEPGCVKYVGVYGLVRMTRSVGARLWFGLWGTFDVTVIRGLVKEGQSPSRGLKP